MSQVVDYAYKQFILTHRAFLLRAEKKLRRCINKGTDYDDIITGEHIPYDNVYSYYLCLKEYNLDFREAIKMNNATKNRVNRLRHYISDLTHNYKHVYFLTFTFTDKILNDTSEKTRRTYIARFLKNHSPRYIANIDYGKNTEREHYHAVASICPVAKFLYPYGFCDFKQVNKDIKDDYKMSKYISKLTNHAVKETASRKSLIYSRNTSNSY